MKVITELINYFVSSGALDEFDLVFLKEQGFITPKNQEDEENDVPLFSFDGYEEYELPEDQLDDLQKKAIAEGKAMAKKGKGRRSKPRQPRLSLDALNERILAKTREWEDHLQTLSAFTGLRKQDLNTLLQKQDAAAEREQISSYLKTMLLQQSPRLDALKDALFFTGHLDFVFGQLNGLQPKKREAVRRWLLNRAPSDKEENREGFRFLNHWVRLQRAALMEWAGHHAHLLQATGFWGETYRQFHQWNPKVSLVFLLLEYSERDLSVPGLPHPVHYFFGKCYPFEEDYLPLTFDYFLTLFPRRFHYFLQNTRRAGQPAGTLYNKHPLCRQLAWMPVPEWMAGQSSADGHIWTCAEPVTTLDFSDLVLETDWFQIAGKFSAKEFFTEARGFGVCERKYDADTQPCSEGRLAVRFQGKWGYIDRHGKWIVSPAYQYARSFSEGWALVGLKNGGSFFINLAGEKQVEFPKDVRVSSFSEGFALVEDKPNFLSHFMDKSLDYFFSEIDIEFGNFSEGKVKFKAQALESFIEKNENGEEITRIILKEYFESFMDKKGNQIGGKYGEVWNFREDRAVVRPPAPDDEFCGFIDENGNEVIPCQFDWAWSFNEGRAAVSKDDAWYYIDKDGNRVSQDYRMAEHFSEGRGGVYIRGRGWSFVDENGAEMPDGKSWYSTSPFHCGLAQCNSGFIDFSGNKLPLPWRVASSFSEGYAIVDDDGKLTIVNEKFELLTDFVIANFIEFPDEFATFEEGRRDDFSSFNHSQYRPYTVENYRIFFEGTAWMRAVFSSDQRQLVFKSEFQEKIFIEMGAFKMTLDGSCIWSHEDGAYLFPSEIKSVHNMDGGRLVLEKGNGSYAIVNWQETLKKTVKTIQKT